MQANLPYLYEGEILDVVAQKGATRKVLRYLCRVETGNGSHIVVKNVEAASMFGGVADYMQIRHRTTKDSGESIKNSSQEEENARIGDRVLISFIGGNIARPMIVGYLSHPNQTIELDGSKPEDIEPQAIVQYNGVRIKVDDAGQLSIIRQGAPTITPAATGGVAGAIASALVGNPDLPASNPAVEPQSSDEVTIMEFLAGGVFRIRDAEGQIIEIDRTKKRIYLSNNDLKSSESAATGPASGGNQLLSNSTDAEYVLLDKDKQTALINARKVAQIYSFDKRKDVTDGDHSHKVGGNSSWLVGKNVDEKIAGKWTVICAGDVTLTGGGATLKLSKGKVGLGNKAIELLKQISDLLQQMATITVPTVVGNSGIPNNAALILKIKALVDLLKTGV